MKYQTAFHQQLKQQGLLLPTLSIEKLTTFYSFLFFGFRQPSAAPIATPTAIHTGSLVAAKTAAPIAVPTPIQFPPLEFFTLFFILIDTFIYSTVTDLARFLG